MHYELVLHPKVKKDFKKLSKAQIELVFKQFKKLEISPELGDLLGNKSTYYLEGCRKLYVDKKKIRIVYRIVETEIIVEVIVVGKRDDMAVYKEANSRIND
ncbi:MAG: type II toxin-antitoxin system RelE/ParE family toxin [Epsilonproteobacteria bacterium]|nr:type II toxin-antitoxin system RelE/ParE family toxin [Campylobacterota bacterium]